MVATLQVSSEFAFGLLQTLSTSVTLFHCEGWMKAMLDRNTAQEAHDHIVEAIQRINQSLILVEGRMPDADFQIMKRTAGIVIGTLDYDYLSRIFELFPELDDVGKTYGIDHLGRDQPTE